MSLVAASAEDLKAGEHMELADKKFLLLQPDSVVPASEKEGLKATLMAGIKEHKMSVFYEDCCAALGWPVDKPLLDDMKKSNAEELEQLAEQLNNAEEMEGEVETMDARSAKAEFFFRIGDKTKAMEAIAEIPVESMSAGTKIDACLKYIRVGLFHLDTDILKENIEKAKKLVAEGGDWERRNRLKIYEASYQLIMRDFAGACENLLSSVATFTCYEVMTYNTFVAYAVLVGMLELKRGELKTKVIDSPDVLTVIRQMPDLRGFLNSLYECDYSGYIRSLPQVHQFLMRSRYLASHAHFYLKEMRVAGYKQFLASYKSVTLPSMASMFGVSQDFMDRELFRFITMGRLDAKIDKVAGVVETNRPDKKNAQYQAALKDGDILLNRIQNLARVMQV